MKKLENKVAIITGAGAGMGKAIALLFVNNGCKVIAADINQDRLNTLGTEVKKMGGIITTIKANMANEVDVDAMINLAKSTYGTLHILVNNAGVMDNFQPVGEVDNETWDHVMKVNVDGPFKAMRAAIKIFMENGSGNIINIASIGGLKGGVAGAAYTTSKHALIGLTKNTGHMYAKTGIRCNAIAPGAVATSIGETIDMTKITPMVQDRIMTGMALNPRIGEPNEIAAAALFLASDDASFINGTVLVVDGGWSSY
jgi:NAD(P)-dependent dehydrogenase (short-subunit alcohol dehydrogenase family)